MSSNLPTSRHRSEKGKKSESDSTVRLSLQDPRSSAGSRHLNPSKVKHERPLTSGDGDTHPDSPNKPRPKSSKLQRRDSAGQTPPSPAQNRRVKSSNEGHHHQRTPIDEKTNEAEQFRKSSHVSMRSNDHLPRPPRKNTNKTPSSTAMPKSYHSSALQGQGRRSGYVDSNPRPYALESDLRKGNNYYLYCLAKIYDITDMKRQKEMQYRNLLARQRQLGFHSSKECEVYTRYLSRPRTAEYSTAYSGQRRTKSTDARSEADRKSRTASAAEDKRRTGTANTEKDQRKSCGDRKPSAVDSKRRLDSSKEGRREAHTNQRDVSRDEEDDEEINRTRRKSENSQNEDIQETTNKDISESDEDKRTKEDKGRPSVSLASNAADAGDESDEDETSDNSESSRRSNIPHPDGNSRPEDATKSVRRSAEEASSDDDDCGTEGNRSGNSSITEVNSKENTTLQKAN